MGDLKQLSGYDFKTTNNFHTIWSNTLRNINYGKAFVSGYFTPV